MTSRPYRSRPPRACAAEPLEPRALLSTGVSPPFVMQAYAAGSAWAGAFKDYLAGRAPSGVPYGSLVWRDGDPNGGGPHRPLPWVNLNQVSVRFTGDVDVAAEDLRVRGVSVPRYNVTDFQYRFDGASETGIATWTLGRPLAADRVLVELEGSPDRSLPPGKERFYVRSAGEAGADLLLRLDVLPGDVGRDGFVHSSDWLPVRYRIFTSTTSVGTRPFLYSESEDVDGSGRIDSLDVLHVRRRIGTRLPQSDPPAPMAPAGTTLFSSDPVAGPGGTTLRLWVQDDVAMT